MRKKLFSPNHTFYAVDFQLFYMNSSDTNKRIYDNFVTYSTYFLKFFTKRSCSGLDFPEEHF